MNACRIVLTAVFAIVALQGARAESFDNDPFFYDPTFAAGGIYVDGIAGPNNGCLEQQCIAKKVAWLSNGDTVTAVELYSWHSDGVGGGYQDDGDFALIRHDASGQRVAWTNPDVNYAHYDKQYVLWPNNDTTFGRMVSRLVDMKAVGGYIYVLFEYTDGSDNGNYRTRTGLSVFNESGKWIQTKYRLLCQIGECSDNAIGLSVLPGYLDEGKHLLAIGTTDNGHSADRGIKVKGMVIVNGTAGDDPNFGDANSRTFFKVPDATCPAAVRPCSYTLRGITSAVDFWDYDYTYTYLVGNVKYANGSGSDIDNDALVVRVGEDGAPTPGFGSGGFKRVAFDVDGKMNDQGQAVFAEILTQQDGSYAGGVYIAANVGDHSIALRKLAPDTGNVDSTFGNNGISVIGGGYCTPRPGCLSPLGREDYAHGLTKDGDRLIVVGTHRFSYIFNGSIVATYNPLFSVARASDGVFTEYDSHRVQSTDADLIDVMPLGNGRYLTAGNTRWDSNNIAPLAVTAQFRADRIFASGMER